MGLGWLVGVAFWAFLAVAVVAGENGRTKRRRADLELLRVAIEKGQPLTPDLVREIFGMPGEKLFIAGCVAIAAGVGLIIFSFLLSRISQHAGWVVSGAGAIATCVGIGLVVSHRLTRRAVPASAPLA